ncbi:hypothetical protein QQZ08_005681 [Neonectria magnoliae]|uniref:Subtilisin n=1 Tax=Neonectria magnoliae TaxID=2732573 RepID=A0ABR1I497_9HYPO
MGTFKSLVSAASLLLLFGTALGETTQVAPGAAVSASAFLTSSSRYIVKFSQTGSAKFRKRDGSTDTSAFYDKLEETGGDASPALSFESDLFHGASFDLNAVDNKTVADIAALPEVEKIWEAAYVSTPTEGVASVQSSIGNNYTAWSPHNDTKVAKMHALGYLGEDVVIAIVDSGIDYTHPAFGGGFGPGYRVEAGYDLVGDDYVPGGEYVPDGDPKDCLGHGTHVAGIAASGDKNLPGVAPKARLRSYKVFGCSDGVFEDVIVSAFLQAYEEGADIISASLGSNRGFADTPTAEVATAIQANGVLVVVAAGNSGNMGPFFTSSGGNGYDSTTVGSVQAEDWVGHTVTATSSSGEERSIVYLDSSFKQFELNGTASAFIQKGAANLTACDWELEAAPSDAVMIIPRGDCGWQLQDTTLIGKATNVFYVQTKGKSWEHVGRAKYSSDQPDGSALILYEDGDWLFTQSENGYNVTFEFVHDYQAVGIPRASFVGGRINDYSSWGPTLDGRMKPEISAPGGSILSTWPVDLGSWAVFSGTSMATPYISGVGALFFGSRGGRKALGDGGALLAHERIIASGKPVRHNDGTDNLASVAKQGAGLVDAEKVLLYSTSVSPANINLNDTVNFVGTHKVEVTNSGDESITYQVSHEPGTTAHTKGSSDAWVSTEPPYSSGDGNVCEVSFSTKSITVGPGETRTLTIAFTEPAVVSEAMLPIYGGSIVLAGDNAEIVRVTYMGIKGSIYASDIWEIERGVPMYFSGYDGLMEEGHNYTFEDGSDFPQPFFNILWSTWELSLDYVSKDWTPSDWVYPTVPGENNWFGSFRLVPNAISGDIVNFPLQRYPRFTGGTFAKPQGYFANGTKIPSGEYMILGRALRTGGDPKNFDDWQYKTSPWFRIIRDKKPDPTGTSVTALPTNTDIVTIGSTSAPAATTTTSVPSCDATSKPVTLKGYVGNEEKGHDFYIFSNFLAIDYTTSQTPLGWRLVNNTRLQTTAGNSPVYASVHTNTNSLVYLYQASSISGSFSFLDCSVVEGQLHCESNDKSAFYICETGQGIIRHGLSPLDGCTALRITLEDQVDCASTFTTTSVSSTTSSVISSITDVLTSSSASTWSTPGRHNTSTTGSWSSTLAVFNTSSTSTSTSTPWTSPVAATSTTTSSIRTPGTPYTSASSLPLSSTLSGTNTSVAITSTSTSTSTPWTSPVAATSTITSSIGTPGTPYTSASSLPWSSTLSGTNTSIVITSTSPTSFFATTSTFESSGGTVETSSTSVSDVLFSTGSSLSREVTSTRISNTTETTRSGRSSTASWTSGGLTTSETRSSSDVLSLSFTSTATENPTLLPTSSVSQESSESHTSTTSRGSGWPTSDSPGFSTSITSDSGAHSTQAPSGTTSEIASSVTLVTSTIFTTNLITITACPSTISNCPVSSRSTYTTTQIIAIGTTVCPVTDIEEKTQYTQTPPNVTTKDISVKQLTTSTAFSTHLVTVTACPSGSVNCPASSKTTYISTGVVDVSTKVYPVPDGSITSVAESEATIGRSAPTSNNFLSQPGEKDLDQKKITTSTSQDFKAQTTRPLVAVSVDQSRVTETAPGFETTAIRSSSIDEFSVGTSTPTISQSDNVETIVASGAVSSHGSGSVFVIVASMALSIFFLTM